MSKQREALHIALEALEKYGTSSLNNEDAYSAAIKTIREALAEPEQEPVAWQYRWLNPNKMDCEPFEMDWKAVVTGPGLTLDAAISNLEAYNERSGKSVYEVRPLYATPPARKPLTDEEINCLLVKHGKGCDGFISFARAIKKKIRGEYE